ncbi:TPA: hypothetical protein QC445_005618 [Bacillus cereus]|nr:hypothetical protein [Bacillus cereus]
MNDLFDLLMDLFSLVCKKKPGVILIILGFVLFVAAIFIIMLGAILTLSMFAFVVTNPGAVIVLSIIFIGIPYLLVKYFKKLIRDARRN